MAGHRWSGWPGAWCFDCGCECAEEVCLATGHFWSDDGEPCPDPEHSSGNCPEPGSNRFNPYEKRKET